MKPTVQSLAPSLSVVARTGSSVLAAAAALLALAQPAQATSYTFNTVGGTGGSPSAWSTSSWSPSTPVSSLDNVFTFTAPSGQRMISTNDLGAGFQLNALNLTNNTSTTNPQTLSIAGSSLNFVKDSGNVLPTIKIAKANNAGTGALATSTITIAAAVTVTDALTVTSTADGGQTNFQGAITNAGGITFNGAGAGTITLGTGVISGAGGITVNGSYNVNMTGNNTYTGLTEVKSGTLTLSRSGGTLANAAAVQVSGGTLAVAQADTVGAVTLASGTISGAGVLTGSSYSLTNTGTVSAVLGGTGVELAKTGAGAATLSAVNTYTGATTVSAGTLALGVQDAVAASAGMVLSGGTLQSNFSQTLGALNLTASSTLDLSSAGVFVFADSSALAGSWTGTLSIIGTFEDGVSVRFGDSEFGLTGDQLGKIKINGSDATIDGAGYLSAVAVPEPSAYAVVAGVLALGCVVGRRGRGRAV